MTGISSRLGRTGGSEISPDDLRQLCGKVKERGAPATAIHVRDIVKQIFGFAILHGEKVPNPADEVGPASIATFEPKDRALSPAEICVLLTQIEKVANLLRRLIAKSRHLRILP